MKGKFWILLFLGIMVSFIQLSIIAFQPAITKEIALRYLEKERMDKFVNNTIYHLSRMNRVLELRDSLSLYQYWDTLSKALLVPNIRIELLNENDTTYSFRYGQYNQNWYRTDTIQLGNITYLLKISPPPQRISSILIEGITISVRRSMYLQLLLGLISLVCFLSTIYFLYRSNFKKKSHLND